MEKHSEFKEAFILGQQSVVTQNHFGIPVIIHPQDTRVSNLEELEKQSRERPRFLEQKSQFDNVDDFIAYVNRYKTQETSIFYNREGKFAASIDWHVKNTFTTNPSWRGLSNVIFEIAERHSKALKAQYDLAFATQIVNNLNQAGLLKDEAGKLLLSPINPVGATKN